jgi:hypothetical protein
MADLEQDKQTVMEFYMRAFYGPRTG